MGHDSSSRVVKDCYMHSSHRLLITALRTRLYLLHVYKSDAHLTPFWNTNNLQIRDYKRNFFNWLSHREPHIKEYHLNGRHRQSS